jgi:hypothetical protein
MWFKLPCLASVVVAISLATSVAVANAAEEGTKTMPDSSVNPPPTPPPTYGTEGIRECPLSNEQCDNQRRR